MNVQQSTFVTVVAWMALVFAGFSAVTGVLQSVVVALLVPIEPMTPEDAATAPLFFRIVFENFHAFVFGFTAFWVVTFICAFGLLRRREWARRAFVVLFTFIALMTIIAGVVQQSLMSTMFAGSEAAPPEAATAMAVMRVAVIVLTLVFVGTFGWAAFKLNSRSIRAEFGT